MVNSFRNRLLSSTAYVNYNWNFPANIINLTEYIKSYTFDEIITIPSKEDMDAKEDIDAKEDMDPKEIFESYALIDMDRLESLY